MSGRITSDDFTRGYWQLKAVADLLDVDPDDALAEVRNLQAKLATAEKRGAVAALHLAANESDALGRPFSGHALTAFARRIGSGEVTLL
jgi:hypothetical protein